MGLFDRSKNKDKRKELKEKQLGQTKYITNMSGSLLLRFQPRLSEKAKKNSKSLSQNCSTVTLLRMMSG